MAEAVKQMLQKLQFYECGDLFVHILQRFAKPHHLYFPNREVTVSLCVVKIEYLKADVFVKVAIMVPNIYTRSPPAVLRR